MVSPLCWIVAGLTSPSLSDPVHGRMPFRCTARRCGRTGRGESTMDVLLMKVPEAAALLGVSRAKLYELIASGALPAVKVDGCRRVRTEDLVSYVNALRPIS